MNIPQVVCMALRESKTIIQKRETKDEPETNNNYKIRQIIIKTMEYNIYIYTHEQIENSPTNIKCSRLIQGTREIKNYIYPVKNKTNLSTNWKTKLKQGAKWAIKQ